VTVGRSLELATVDLRLMVRRNTDFSGPSASVVGLAMFVVVVLGATLGGGYLAYGLGGRLAAGELPLFADPAVATRVLGGTLALLGLVTALVFALRGLGQRGTLARPEAVLPVVHTGEALRAVVLAEAAFAALWFVPPAVGVGVGLALGSGAVWPVLAVPAAGLALSVAAVAVGYPLGLAVRHLATRFPVVVRNRGAIIVVAFTAYVVVLTSGVLDETMARLFGPLSRSPAGWFGDLFALGTPGLAASPAAAVGAVGLTLAVGVVGTTAGAWLARRHWFSDPALAGDPAPDVTPDGATRPGAERWLTPAVGTTTAALVAHSWRQARRSPIKLLYALYPVLLLVGVLADVVRTGVVPSYLPYVVVLVTAWGAGVVFTLNPLGDEGAGLSTTLLSRVDGRTFVRARLLASVAVVVPVAVLATAAVAVLSPLGTSATLALVAAAPAVVVLSAALSVGVGMAFPRFEATAVTRSLEAVLPSRWAFLLFSLHLSLAGAAAAVVWNATAATLGAGLLTWLLPFGATVAADPLRTVAAGVLVVLVVLPLAAYRYAVRRFERYTLA
jgi:hypothetical protein